MKKIVDQLLKNKDIGKSRKQHTIESKKSKEIEENLKQYAKEFQKINYRYALIRLAMNYYTYYTIICEDEGIRLDYQYEITAINEIIHRFLSGDSKETETTEELRNRVVSETTENFRTGIDLETTENLRTGMALETAENLRNRIISRMQDLTCFVDRFNIYEHVLNRVEYRFKNQDISDDYSDEALTRTLMQFILEDEDSVVVNQKISQVIGQLPIRITKNKFYEMLSAGLSIYQEGTKNSLDDFLYMIRTSGMIEESGTMKENYPHLLEVLDQFKQIHFKTISSEEYEEMRYNINNASEYMKEQTDQYLMLQEIVNDLLLVLYSGTDGAGDAASKVCVDIIYNTYLLFTDKFSEKSPEQIEGLFVNLEGVQERLYPKLTAYDITDQIRENYMEMIADLGMKDVYENIFKLPKLNSDSLFANLYEEPDESLVTEQYLKEQQERLIGQFQQLFGQNEKIINRAVMSIILSELPVFFNNISELQDYIYNCLSICTDKAEKLACIEIMNGFMEA